MKSYPLLLIFLAIFYSGTAEPFHSINTIVKQFSTIEYKQTLSPNHVWYTAHYNGFGQSVNFQRHRVDTTLVSISNEIYHQILSSPDSSGNNWVSTHRYVREAEGKLWLIDSTINTQAICIMDMNLDKGDEFSYVSDATGQTHKLLVFAIDSIIDKDLKIRKVIHLSCSLDPLIRYNWIEGIGPDQGVFSPTFLHCQLDGSENILTCFYEDNVQIWQSEHFAYCWKPLFAAIDTTDMDASTMWYSSSYVSNFAEGDCRKKIEITKVARDTIIHDRLCRIIGVFTSGEYLPESEIITFVKERKVFFYEDNAWKLLYDYGKSVGDTVTYFVSKKFPYYEKLSVPSPFEQDITDGNPYRLVINSVDTMYDAAGNPLKRFHTHNLENTTGHTMGIVIENVGSIHKFFGSNIIYAGPECNEFDIMGLRCYSDDDNFLKFVSGKCDEITSVNFNNIDNKITIYPNPGHDHVTIQMNTDVSLPLRYQIIDVCGRVMEMGNRNHDHWTQATGHLISGLYIISILDAKGRHWTNKWTKQ